VLRPQLRKIPLEHRELKEKFYHLKLMRKGAPGLLIKAAGGIRTLNDLKRAIKLELIL
jgi:deoxyribose-phosphate aldolase